MTGMARLLSFAAARRHGSPPQDAVSAIRVLDSNRPGGEHHDGNIALARTLLLHAKLIVVDQPVSMMDASLRATMLGSPAMVEANELVPVLALGGDKPQGAP
jgi:ABC-type antimicrobial peptide transport system ATPase subunit